MYNILVLNRSQLGQKLYQVVTVVCNMTKTNVI